VAQVLDSKFDKCRKDPLLYYVQWSGYENMADEYSWLTADGVIFQKYDNYVI